MFPGGFGPWEWTQIQGSCPCSSSSSSLWPGNVRGTRSSLRTPQLGVGVQGRMRRELAQAGWESHPAAPGGQGSPPTTSFFFFLRFFLWLLKDNQEFCSAQFRPGCGKIPRVVSEPNCSSGLPNSCCVLWQRELPGSPLPELLSGPSHHRNSQFLLRGIRLSPPDVFVLESHRIPLLFPATLCYFTVSAPEL